MAKDLTDTEIEETKKWARQIWQEREGLAEDVIQKLLSDPTILKDEEIRLSLERIRELDRSLDRSTFTRAWSQLDGA